MTWKQPIPTNLESIFGNDKRGMVLYVFLLLNASNTDSKIIDTSGREVDIKRGQSIFGRDRYSEILGCSPKTAERTLSKICLNSVLKMTKKATTSFTVVTFENYDEITTMTNKRPTNDQQMTTSKNIKSVKNTPIVPTESQELDEVVGYWNGLMGTKFRSKLVNLNNYLKAKENYSLEEIKLAVKNIPLLAEEDKFGTFWKSMTPVLFFRQRNTSGETADYIDRALNYKPIRKLNDFERMMKANGL